MTFTTTATPPTVSVGSPSYVTGDSATLVGSVNPQGKATTYSFQYGPTTSYGLQSTPASAGSGSSSVNVHASLSNLQSGTTYHYRLVATSSDGSVASSDGTFSTTGNPPTSNGPLPVVSSVGSANVTSHTVQLNGAVNPQGPRTTWYFQYGPTGYYGTQSSPQSMSGFGARPVDTTLSGLQSGTTYHFRLVAYSAHGLYVGLDHTFTTMTVTRAHPRGLFLRTYAHHRGGYMNLVLSGSVGLPGAVPASRGCSGAVAVEIKRGHYTIWFNRAYVRSNCSYGVSVNLSYRTIAHSSRLGVFERFEGNSMLYPMSTQQSVRVH
jgi:hypothetical protein